MVNKLALLSVALVAVLLMALSADAVVVRSNAPHFQFNITRDTIYLNWTAADTPNPYEANITIAQNGTSAATSLRVALQNQTRSIAKNYSQPLSGWFKSSFAPTTANCDDGVGNKQFQVKNGSSILTNETQALSNNGNESLTVFATANRTCMPGRYWGLLNVTNATDTGNYTNVTVVIDIPIDSDNSYSTSGDTNGVGQFMGTFDGNETEDHRYYFFTNATVNATSVTVNLSWATKDDVDVFLFDQTDAFLARSNNHSLTEKLTWMYPRVNVTYGIRVYGNNTTHAAGIAYQSPGGFLIIGTLNATNSSNTSQRYDTISLGQVATSSVNQIGVMFTNIAPINQTNVAETKEIHSVQRFHSNVPTGPANYSVRVPDYVTKIDVRLNWTGATNYTLRLIKPDGTQHDISNNKSAIANKTGSVQEEVVVYTPSTTVGLSDDGLWTVEVRNNTIGPDRYNMTARLYTNASAWLTSNYSTRSFNQSGLLNTNGTHHFNLTAQNLTMGGDAEGVARYTSATGAIHNIPFTYNVTTAELFVNGTFNSSTVTITDNVGFNRTGTSVLLINVTVNNTGNVQLTFDARTNSSGMNLTSNMSQFVDFTIEEPSSSIAAAGSSKLNVSVDVNTLETSNTEGVYSGWVGLNDTSSRPYEKFNLTVRVNLTRELDVYQINVNTLDNDAEVENVSLAQNITLKAEIFLKNGTEITDLQNASGNFTVYIQETNTSHRLPSVGSFSLTNGTASANDPVFANGVHSINATWPSNSSAPGGYYQVYVGAMDRRTGVILFGNSSNSTIMKVNNTGLLLTAITSTSIEVDEAATTTFNLTVKNLGTVKPGGFLNMSTSSIATITANDSGGNCKESASANGFIFDRTDDAETIATDGTETCWFRFKIVAQNVSSDQTTTLTVSAQSGDVDYGDLSVALTVDNDAPAEEEEEEASSGAASTTTTTTEEDAEVLDVTEFPASTDVTQGQSKSVVVKVTNVGNETQEDVGLTVTGIESSWFSVTPSSQDILEDEEEPFTVKFTPPADADVKEYSITYKASSAGGDDEASAKLRVQPTNETKTLIDAKYAAALQNLTELEERFDDADGEENTTLNSTLTQLREKLRLAGEALAAGDYVTANQLLAEAEALRAQLDRELASVEDRGSRLVWVVAGVVVLGAIGLVAYMMMPPTSPTGPSGFKYAPPGGGSPIDRARRKAKQIADAIKAKLRREKGPPKFNFARGGTKWA